MGRLFGTDGVRGVANSELTCEMAMNIGRAAAMVLTDNNHRHPKILIGKDTRISSDMLESAITAGLCSVGANVVQLGVVPTPAVAFLVGKYKADAGVMLTASHNPCEFNGIKIFSGDGYKLPDALEEQIEAIVLDHVATPPTPVGGDLGAVTTAPNVVRDYVDHVKSTVPFSLDGLRIAIDCANGASSRTAETLFTELGAECHMIANEPNGVNVNDKCGSTHMEGLMAYVKEHGAAFIMCIGGKLKSGRKHDGRSPDYDDWNLNGDIVLYYPPLGCAFELSSMGIRVDEKSLLTQLEVENCLDRLALPFHKALAAGELPLTMGGGIGQSRLCMFLLNKVHVGEVQVSVWDEKTEAYCRGQGIVLM